MLYMQDAPRQVAEIGGARTRLGFTCSAFVWLRLLRCAVWTAPVPAVVSNSCTLLRMSLFWRSFFWVTFIFLTTFHNLHILFQTHSKRKLTSSCGVKLAQEFQGAFVLQRKTRNAQHDLHIPPWHTEAILRLHIPREAQIVKSNFIF